MAVKKKAQRKQAKRKTPPSRSPRVLTSAPALEAALADGVVALLTQRSKKVLDACALTQARVVLIHSDVAMRVGFGFLGVVCFFVDGVFVSSCSSDNAAAVAKELRRAQQLVGRARAEGERWCAEAPPAADDDFAAGLTGDYVCGTFRLQLQRDGAVWHEWRSNAADPSPAETESGTWRRMGRDIEIVFRERKHGVEAITRRWTMLIGWTDGQAVELRHPRVPGVLPRLTADSRVDWRRADRP